jgi:hypothetical protein
MIRPSLPIHCHFPTFSTTLSPATSLLFSLPSSFSSIPSYIISKIYPLQHLHHIPPLSPVQQIHSPVVADPVIIKCC